MKAQGSYNWRTGRDGHALERAITLYRKGHRLADCARRCQVGLGELRAELRERGHYRRNVTP